MVPGKWLDVTGVGVGVSERQGRGPNPLFERNSPHTPSAVYNCIQTQPILSAYLLGYEAQFLGISLYFAGKWPANYLDIASGAVYFALRRHFLWQQVRAFYTFM